jgi:hypothetical protein
VGRRESGELQNADTRHRCSSVAGDWPYGREDRLFFRPGVYTGNNKPHFNLWDAEKDPKFAGQNVVQDDHMWAQAIWGYEKNLPPYDPNDKGHFHVGTAEWWVIMKGQIRHNIETVGDFTSNEGDIVYAPPSTWRDRGPRAIVPSRDQRISVHVAIGTARSNGMVDGRLAD